MVEAFDRLKRPTLKVCLLAEYHVLAHRYARLFTSLATRSVKYVV